MTLELGIIMKNNFKDNLFNMLEELGKHHNDRAKLIEFYINDRLNKSLASYYEALDKSINYLSKKDELKVLKQIGEEDK